MDRVRLQFWNALRYILTFLCFLSCVLIGLDLSGKMPGPITDRVSSQLLPLFPTFVPPHFQRLWVPLSIITIILLSVLRLSKQRMRLWGPSDFPILPAPNGGYLRIAGSAPFRREPKEGIWETTRKAKESYLSGARHLAENGYKSAAAEFQQSTLSAATKSAYLNLGVALFLNSNMQRASTAFAIGLPVTDAASNEKFVAAFLNNTGILKRERGELKDALTCFERTYAIYEKTHDTLGRACALGNIGSIHLLVGRVDEAMESWGMAHEGFKDARFTTGRAAALDNIGNVYGGKREFKRAIKCHREALRIYRQTRNVPGQAQALANIGYACFKLGRWRRSIRASRKALKIAERVDSYLVQAKAHSTIGLAYQKRGKSGEALQSVQTSLDLYEQVGNPVGVGDQLAAIGVVYAAQGRKRDALLKWAEARSKFLQTGVRSEGYYMIENAKELSLHENTFDESCHQQDIAEIAAVRSSAHAMQ